MLAPYAEAIKPAQRVMPDPQTRELKALLARRRQLLMMIVAEGNRDAHAIDVVRRGIAATVRCLKKQVAALDRELASSIRESPAWREKSEVLRSVPGVVAVASATLLAGASRSRDFESQANCSVGRSRAIQSRQWSAPRPADDLGRTVVGARGFVHVLDGRDNSKPDHQRPLSTPLCCRQTFESRSGSLHAQTHRDSQCSNEATNTLDAATREHVTWRRLLSTRTGGLCADFYMLLFPSELPLS